MAAGTIFILLGVVVLISGGLFLIDFGEMWNIGWWHDTFVRTEWFKIAPAVFACGLILLSIGVLTVMVVKRTRRILGKVNRAPDVAVGAAVPDSRASEPVCRISVGSGASLMTTAVLDAAEPLVPESAKYREPFFESEILADDTQPDAQSASRADSKAEEIPGGFVQEQEAAGSVDSFSRAGAELNAEDENAETYAKQEKNASAGGAYNMSFKALLISDAAEGGKLQDYYTELKNELLSYRNVKSRMSWESEVFNYGRVQLARWTVRGKSLRMYFALIPLTIDEKYHVSDASDSTKFSRTPVMLKVNGVRSLGHAKELISKMMELYGIVRAAARTVDYHLPKMTETQMLERGLIKRREARDA